ncbi:hypothetical protein [Clavibacter tessellarius]|uniref:hypothetical protein n=1 Tax=Clavibacter tessellarius TaxID=31965 RepID=UPI0032543754
MPSYRIAMTVGALRAGADPSDVLPAAARVAAEHATLEANDIQVVRGEPRLTVRFTADDDAMAERVAGAVRARTAEARGRAPGEHHPPRRRHVDAHLTHPIAASGP